MREALELLNSIIEHNTLPTLCLVPRPFEGRRKGLVHIMRIYRHSVYGSKICWILSLPHGQTDTDKIIY